MISELNKASHYDYIVVGAGAAGSVLAAELSASGAQVLVIESGGPDDAPTIANGVHARQRSHSVTGRGRSVVVRRATALR
ncbi:MAG TPA: NAD(P)-binding protein [Pyrinomonadaceae bacterium]